MEQQDRKFPYRLCVVKTSNNDLSKRWYVEFYVWDENKGKLVRKQDFSLNSYKTVADRLRRGQEIKREIDAALKAGKIIKKVDAAPAPAPVAVSPAPGAPEITVDSTLKEAISFAVKIKTGSLSDRSGSTYRSIKNILFSWIEEAALEDLRLGDVTPGIMSRFFDYLKLERKVDNITHNNYLLYSRAIFNLLVRREIIEKSPCSSIKNLPEQEKSHVPFLDEQRLQVKEYLELHDPQLLLFCTFMYYTFVRRSELRFLQVKNIQKKKIHIPGYIYVNGKKTRVSKNGKAETVVIPDGLENVINELNLRNYPADYFIFGQKGQPGPKHLGLSYFSNKHILCLRELGLNDGQTLYSWKHTGVVKLYMAIKDIRKIQQQCRHSSIAMTEKYLRGLGLFDNEEVQALFPAF
ncbi:site-specific integrase [Rufibacter immobilis]|uniref:Site-specific integrase n=1 Tax=Rufibacter immobilis TaxID=1348778 RepID=A0A3M9MQ94_9BACT|nr:site-specific integrase [Rufibacter immobilis]RNI27680.1 site-specific integrase [Rufibacter immobilis]